MTGVFRTWLKFNAVGIIGVRMFDAHPDSIAAQLARRDASGIYSDWVHVIIGPEAAAAGVSLRQLLA